MISKFKRELARKEFERGKSYSIISKQLGVPLNTLKCWKKRYGWERLNNVERSASNMIREELLSHLEKKNAKTETNIDLVNDYMSLWEIKNKLIADIEKRGVQVETFNSSGNTVYKKNDSVTELLKTNSQMLKILSDLGLTASMSESNDDDDI